MIKVTSNPHGQMVTGNNTIWMRKSTLGTVLNSLNKISSSVAYKQAALNAIAYLQKVLYIHHFFSTITDLLSSSDTVSQICCPGWNSLTLFNHQLVNKHVCINGSVALRPFDNYEQTSCSLLLPSNLMSVVLLWASHLFAKKNDLCWFWLGLSQCLRDTGYSYWNLWICASDRYIRSNWSPSFFQLGHPA